MPGTTRTWLSMAASIRAAILVRRVIACLLLVVAVQYLFIAFVVYRPYVTMTTTLTSSSPEHIDADNRESVDEQHALSIAARSVQLQLRARQSTTSPTGHSDDRHRMFTQFSILRERVMEFFSPIVGRSSLPPCHMPSKVPVELNWSIDDSSGDDGGATSSPPQKLDLNDVTSVEKLQYIRGRHLPDGDDDDRKLGGRWTPRNCTARHNIAVIVPYRARASHLDMFIHYMHPFLQRQLIDYTIYVVEQTPTSRFNRGLLLNVGFTEAKRLGRHRCYFFHDVDLLPESDFNLYTCPDQPRHVSAAVNTLSYRLPYKRIFGGVEAFKTEHFELVNGFSNLYFGWGGEDDDLYQRVIFHRLNLTRYPMSIARYTMLKHRKDKPSPDRIKLLKTGLERMEVDGLNSLCYRLEAVDRLPLYTRLLVDIDENYHVSSTTANVTQQCTYNTANDQLGSDVNLL